MCFVSYICCHEVFCLWLSDAQHCRRSAWHALINFKWSQKFTRSTFSLFLCLFLLNVKAKRTLKQNQRLLSVSKSQCFLQQNDVDLKHFKCRRHVNVIIMTINVMSSVWRWVRALTRLCCALCGAVHVSEGRDTISCFYIHVFRELWKVNVEPSAWFSRSIDSRRNFIIIFCWNTKHIFDKIF